MNIFFDIDLTIVSASYELRPHTREVMESLKTAGHKVYLWSMGGKDFAESMVARHDLHELVEACLDKRDPLAIQPDLCIDDEPYYVNTYGGHVVSWYLMNSAHDREMLRVLQQVLSEAEAEV